MYVMYAFIQPIKNKQREILIACVSTYPNNKNNNIENTLIWL